MEGDSEACFVEPQGSGIGGGGFMVRSDGENSVTIDGRETAPAAATPNRFLDEKGERLPRDTRVISGLSVGVPGNIALAAKAHAAHGKLDWAELFGPAIRLARAAMEQPELAGAALNGAKEAALEAFIAGRIGFLDMSHIVEASLTALTPAPVARDVEDVYEMDAAARRAAESEMRRRAS